MRIILLGSPGAGKGTQGKRLAKHFDNPAIATGDMFRAAIENDTPIGRKARAYMDKGHLVPDDIVLDMIKERLSHEDAQNGFIFDGFPRTLEQANRLEENVMAPLNIKLNAVLFISVPKEIVVKRISGRRRCEESGKLYNIELAPEVWENSDDKANGYKLTQRSDDKAHLVEKRFEIYLRSTMPLVEFYQKRGLLHEINGVGEVDEIFDRILEVL